MDDDLSLGYARVLQELRDDSGPDIIRVGVVPPEMLAHWSNTTTLELIITRERRSHYLARHPEVLNDEP